MLAERSSNKACDAYAWIRWNSPTSYVCSGHGGTVDTLRRRVNAARIITGQTERRVRTGSHVQKLESTGAAGRATYYSSPSTCFWRYRPRHSQGGIEFTPPLPLKQQWRETARVDNPA